MPQKLDILPTMPELGAALRAARKECGLTPQDVADRAALSLTQVYRIEGGCCDDVFLLRFLRICRTLGTGPEAVIDRALAWRRDRDGA